MAISLWHGEWLTRERLFAVPICNHLWRQGGGKAGHNCITNCNRLLPGSWPLSGCGLGHRLQQRRNKLQAGRIVRV